MAGLLEPISLHYLQFNIRVVYLFSCLIELTSKQCFDCFVSDCIIYLITAILASTVYSYLGNMRSIFRQSDIVRLFKNTTLIL